MTLKPYKDRFSIKGTIQGGSQAGTTQTPFDEFVEPAEEEELLKPFVDRFGTAKKVVAGSLSGSAVVPFADAFISRSVPSSTQSGSDISAISHLLQGVEIVNNFQRENRVLPIFGSGKEDHTIDQNIFGIGEKLKEIQGTIEPLTIRNIVFGRSTFEIEPHTFKGHLLDGNEDELGETNKIVQSISKNEINEDKNKFYIDSNIHFGDTLTGSIKIPGIIDETTALLTPFDETEFDRFLSSSLSGSFSKFLVSMSLGSSGSHKDLGLSTHKEKSTTAGFIYDSVIDTGTDSLAFGDTQEYQRRGFLRRLDSITGSVPTNVRTGDKDRKGNFKIKFDDTRTITYENNVLLDVQRNIQSSSIHLTPPFLSQSIDLNKSPRFYPYVGQKEIERATSQSIYAIGTVRKGVGDSFIRFDDFGEEDLTLFEEEQIFDNKTDDFWKTGSLIEDVGNGFTRPLLSKTRIEIDLVPQISTVLSASSGSLKYPMGYFNFKSKNWEGIGTGKNFISAPSTITDATLDLERLMFGFNVSNYDTGGTSDFGALQQGGMPISNFGFPIHAKFHATSSQLYHMSRSICHPFLVEKVVYEFSGSFMTPAASGPDGHTATFFMLNQRENFNLNKEFYTETQTGTERLALSTSIPTNIHLSAGGEKLKVSSIRDLITFNNVSIFQPSFSQSDFDAQKGDLNIIGSKASVGGEKQFVSGTFILSGTVRSPSNNPGKMGMFKVAGGDFARFFMRNEFGGRNALGTSTGRDFVNSVLGFNSSGSFEADGEEINPNKTRFINNPYLIMPDDKVVFGWQTPFPYNLSTNNRTEMQIGPTKGKIVLYGSLVKNKKEYHDTLNQPLTSNALMEIIGDEPILDQNDIDYYQMLSGSYIDSFITGTMSNDTLTHRRIAGSALGQNGAESGSFFRNTQLSSNDERFFDSLVPDPAELTILNDKQVVGAGVNSITFGHYIESIGETTEIYDNDWVFAFPFEPKYSSLKRIINPFKILKGTIDTAGAQPDPPILNKKSTLRQSINDDTIIHLTEVGTAGTGSGDFARAKTEDKIKHYYGIGDFISGTVNYVKFNRTSATVAEGEGSILRGWKYGLINGLPQYSKIIFRRNRYGQFRDMLEQRMDTKFFSTTKNENVLLSSPVRVFFSASNGSKKPYQTTNSSNMSFEATSSIPYFDGIFKNR